MSIDDIFEICASANICISITGDSLRVTNASALTNEIRNGLRLHKQQIIKELSMPILNYALMMFPDSIEIGANGKKIKNADLYGGLF